MSLLDDVIRHFGGPAETAKELNCTPAAIRMWRMKGYIPPARAYEIQTRTGGKFRAIDIIDEADRITARLAAVDPDRVGETRVGDRAATRRATGS